MNQRSQSGQESRQLDRKAGRQASRGQLTRDLASAPLAFLTGALENPNFTPIEAVLLLRNHQATQAILKRIAGEAAWGSARAVRKALVRHPQVTPLLAARLLPSLFWKDLAETCAVPGVPAAVRHAAESILRQRVCELTLGERIALARLASRGIIPALASDHEAAVLVALLGNPLLLEAEAQALAGRPRPQALLSGLARHPRWERNAAVMIAVAGNPATPISVALGVVSRLGRQARQRLANNAKVPKIVRVAAERPPVGRAPSDLGELSRLRAQQRGHRS